LELVLVDEYLISREVVIGYLTPLEAIEVQRNEDRSFFFSLLRCYSAPTLSGGVKKNEGFYQNSTILF